LFRDVVGAVVVTEAFTVAGFAPGVTLDGITEQVLNMGAPLHDNVIAVSNDPDTGDTLSM